MFLWFLKKMSSQLPLRILFAKLFVDGKFTTVCKCSVSIMPNKIVIVLKLNALVSNG